MAIDLPSPDIGRERADKQRPGVARDRGFAHLARRIAGRTTDLVAIGVLLIAGLSIGRQVHEWWQSAPPDAVPQGASGVAPDLWGNPQQSVEMQFGDAPLSLSRQMVTGDREKALGELVGVCREIVARSQPPRLADADDAEATLVARTRGLKPSAENPGVWQVFRLDDRFSMVVGLRNQSSQGRVADAGAHDEGPRLVCWGLALPLGADQWGLYTFTSLAAASGVDGAHQEVELPPGARRSLGLRSATGSMIGFSGKGSDDSFRSFFSESLRAEGWRSPGGWVVSGRESSIQFTKDARNGAGELTIQFASDGAGGITGLVCSVHPQAPSRKESDE